MIDVKWLQIGTQDVLLYAFPPLWGWDEFFLAQHRADVLLDTRGLAVPVIFDFSHGAYMPSGMLKQMRQIIATWNPYGKSLIVVGGNTVIENAFSVAARMLNANQRLADVQFVNSYHAAACLIEQRTTHEVP